MEKKIEAKAEAQLEFTIKFTLSVGEAQALDAIAGYGSDAFLETFYPKMGKSYLQPHEAEMRNLFKKIRSQLPKEISKVESARKAIKIALEPFKP